MNLLKLYPLSFTIFFHRSMKFSRLTFCLFAWCGTGASMRYRITHHHEHLKATTSEIDKTIGHNRIGNLQFHYSVLYIHRLPLTSRTLPLVVLAKLYRIPIIFDSDDLVWDPREREYNFLDKHYPPDVINGILKGTSRLHAMMRLADAFVFSTPYLAQRAALDFRQPAFVNLNALSREQVGLSSIAMQMRINDSRKIVIGYFSGQAKVHDEDFAIVAPALRAILDRYPKVSLRTYGGLALPTELRSPMYLRQIEQYAAVDWRELPQHIANVDINIAPLIDNPQRRSKSAVKYLEAAAVGVPTVAVDLEPYALIQHDATGMLASNTTQWEAALIALIEDAALRQQLGSAARADVLAHHTTDARAPNFLSILEQIKRQ